MDTRDSSSGHERDDRLFLLRYLGWRLVLAMLAVAALIVVSRTMRPSYNGRAAAYRAMMKSDLRNLVTAQEAYYGEHQAYASSLQDIVTDYVASNGDTVMIERVGATGFSAIAHTSLSKQICGIFVAHAGAVAQYALSFSPPEGGTHDLLLLDKTTWLERWPAHQERYREIGSDSVQGSSGVILGSWSRPSLQLFVRYKGEQIPVVLWRYTQGPWHTLGRIVAGPAMPLSRASADAEPFARPTWPGAQEGTPICWDAPKR